LKTSGIIPKVWTSAKKLKTISTKNKVLAAVVVVVVIAAVVYEFVVPQVIGNSYKQKLQTATANYALAMDKLSDSTMRPLFTNPDSTPKSDKNDLIIVSSAITDAKSAMNDLTTTSNTLTKLPFAGYFGSYRHAKQLKTDVSRIISSNTTTVNKYDELVMFMQEYNVIAVKLEETMTQLGTLESLTDINKLVEALNGLKQSFLDTASQLSAINAPAEFIKIKADTLTFFNDMANGVGQMATAALNLDLTAITDASKAIDSAIAKSTEIDKSVQAIIGQDTAFIKSIKALKDSTAALTF
jgi:hypothetical protein